MRRSILISTVLLATLALAGTLWLIRGAFSADALLLNPDAIDFGLVGVGEEVQGVAIATNVGDALIEIDSIQAPEGFRTSRDGLRLEPGESAEIVVTFRPEEPGRRQGELVLAGPSLRTHSVRLDALAQLPPAIEVAPQQISFGGIGVGRTGMVELAFSNRGEGELEVDAVVAPKPFKVSRTALAVPAGESRIVELRFSPEEVGEFNEFLSVRSNDPERALVQVRLNGTALERAPEPRIEVDPAAVDFGRVSACSGPLRWVTVRNGGTDPLTLSSLRYPEGFIGPARGRRVKPGREFSVPVTFAPRTGGKVGGALKIFSNDPSAGVMTVSLSGNGAACSDEALAQIAERRTRRPTGRSGSRTYLQGSSGGSGSGGAGVAGGAPGGFAGGEAAPAPGETPVAGGDEGSPDATPVEPKAVVGEDSSWKLASYESKFDDLNVDASSYDPNTGNLRLEISPPAIDAALGEFFQGEWVIEGQVDAAGDFTGEIAMTIYDASGKPLDLVISVPSQEVLYTGDGQPVFPSQYEPFVDGEGSIPFLHILPQDFTLGGQPIRGVVNVSLNSGD